VSHSRRVGPGDVPKLARDKANEVSRRPTIEAWGALAVIWARLYVLAGPGWSRWPAFRSTVDAAMTAALGVAASGGRPHPQGRDLVAALEGFPIEDDGSAEWQHLIDVVAMIQEALGGTSVENCVEHAIVWYLEGESNVLSNELARSQGRTLFLPEAQVSVEAHPRWARATAFVETL
jgi:hypothetical protein